MPTRLARLLLTLPPALLLAGCEMVVMSPSGDVAMQQRNLIIISTVLMLLIVLPVMALTGWFAWRYRASNTKATYTPDWNHSTALELVIWSAPLLIVIALGAVTWIATHTLDPFRKLDRIGPNRPVPEDVRPLRVQVVALDWKWLFIYPDYGVASVNEMAAPVDVPIEFQITSSTVMNAFYVPALAGMIYAMPAMETRLHAVINRAGDYEGFSSNYSGAGFSHMRFAFKARSGADFDAWLAELRTSSEVLSRARYQELELPSAKEPVRHFKSTAQGLYSAILNLCVDPNKMCMHDMMKIDAAGGLGLGSAFNVAQLRYDQPRDAIAPSRYVLAMCAAEPERFLSADANAASYGDYSPLP